jgi:PIN domain
MAQAPPLAFLIPVVVVRELDALKSSSRVVSEPENRLHAGEASKYASKSAARKKVPLGVLARRAIDWIHANVDRSGVVRGQRRTEVLAADIFTRAVYPGVRGWALRIY